MSQLQPFGFFLLSISPANKTLTSEPLGMLDAEVSMETAPCAGPVMDKVKRRYRKKKGKLEEAFPSYLQVMLKHTRVCVGIQ